MKLSIQYAMAGILICSATVTAENIIRYLFNNGDAQPGLECSLSEIKKIESIFQIVNDPLNLRKRQVDNKDRQEHAKFDMIYQFNFDETNQNQEIANFNRPNCDDDCTGYHPDKCFAFVLESVSHEHDTTHKNRELQGLSFNSTEDKMFAFEHNQGTYPAKCKRLCEKQASLHCQGVPQCQGYRRQLSTASQNEGTRDLQLPATFNITSSDNQGTYPAKCKRLCERQASLHCQGVPQCQGYRRTLQEESAIIPPAGWCVKASKAIDEKLNELLQHMSPKCRTLIQSQRRVECYDDEAVCSTPE